MSAREEVERLLEKYRTMRELRELRRRGGEPPREVLRDLARRFPGALAEIDRISPALLDERIAQLEAILDRPPRHPGRHPGIEVLPDWARGWLLAHARLRGALAIKAWLCGRRAIDEATRARFDREPFSEEARAWSDRLDALADPPGGRIVSLVYDEVARALDIEASAVRALLMPRG